MLGRWLCLVISGLAMVGAAFSVYRVSHIPKIGVVDNGRLIANFSEAIAARKILNKQNQQWEENLKSLKDSVEYSVQRMAKEYDRANAKQRKELEKNLEHWNREYARYSKAVHSMSADKERELTEPVVKKLNDFVRTWGEEHGYDVILGSANGGVILSVHQPHDITVKVLADLNNLYGDTHISDTTDAISAVSIKEKDSKTVQQQNKAE